MFEGQSYKEILIALGGLRFRENFEVNCGKGCMRNNMCNVDFGYQRSICFTTKENHGSPKISIYYIQRFSSYLTENNILALKQPVGSMLFREIITV